MGSGDREGGGLALLRAPLSPSEHSRIFPLRVDGELRRAVAEGGGPSARRSLARLLLQHGLANEALLAGADGADEGAFLAECLLARGPPWGLSVGEAERIGKAEGRAAFELALLAGRGEMAADIASRTPGELGVNLCAELHLRAGTLPPPDPGEGALSRARRAWVQGDLTLAAAELERLLGPDVAPAEAEVLLMRATLARRTGHLKQASRLLAAAQAAADVPLPALALERLLIAVTRPHLSVQDADQFECLPWATGERGRRRMWVPATWRLRRVLERLDGELGPFRGRVLTRTTAGGFAAMDEADDLRFRLASLRSGLLVADGEVVLGVAAALGRVHPASALVPSYLAELLHWLGRHEEAGAQCERAIALDPTVRWAYLGLAQSKMWSGDLPGAEAVLSRLRTRHPRLPTLPAVDGELALLRGRHEAARRLLRDAVRVHPGRWSAGLLLALAEWRSGEPATARGLLHEMRVRTPGAWPDGVEPDDVEANVRAQLAAMRGNRSSGFITLFHPDREALLVQGYRHPAVGGVTS